MFLNSRDEFKNYLGKSKKPFMATFYKEVRKKSRNINGCRWKSYWRQMEF